MKRLSEKQIAFIAAFNGNATEAAEIAGYSTPDVAGVRCLKNVRICKAIKERQEKEFAPKIATRQERQAFWAETMRREDVDFPHRLKASELLGKSEGDFLDRVRDESGPKIIKVVVDDEVA